MDNPIVLEHGLEAPLLPFARLPVIDFDDFLSGRDPQRVADEIGRACRDVGFFYLTGHGVAEAAITRTFAEARGFFDRPEAEKEALHISRSPNHRGWFRLFEENTDPNQTADRKEGFDLARDLDGDDPRVKAGLPLHGPNVWPQLDNDFRPVMEGYYASMCRLADQLMQAIALSLGLDRLHFRPMIDDPLAQLRLLHYPPQAGHVREAEIGIGAHSDYGCLTILAQDQIGGLQVRNAAGDWIQAPPLPGSFVINLGDQLARWTNDFFKATVHRVINVSGRDRYSIPFFFDPNWDAEIACLEVCRPVDGAPKYEAVQAGPYLLSRLGDTFNYLQT